MKVSTTSFGNYKPVRTNQATQLNESKLQNNDPKITNEEKKYFSKLYPDEKEIIENYHFYNRNGDKNGVSLGSLVDRRG